MTACQVPYEYPQSVESDPKIEFAQRLNQALNEMQPPAPGEGDGRQDFVASLFGVDQTGARKWLRGEGFPAIGRAIQIAKRLNVSFEWLMTGRGEKRVLDKENAELVRLLDLWFKMPKEAQQQFMRYGEFLCSDNAQPQQPIPPQGVHHKLQ